MRRFRPILPADPGWLFVLSGMTVIAFALLLPAQRQLHGLLQKEAALTAQEGTAYERLHAYSDFLGAIDDRDETLIRRLAAAQLNQIPVGERPVMLASSINRPVTDWIDATVSLHPHVARDYPHTRLGDLVQGEWRQWVIGGSVLCLFVGLLLRPESTASRGTTRAECTESRISTDQQTESHLSTDGRSQMPYDVV